MRIELNTSHLFFFVSKMIVRHCDESSRCVNSRSWTVRWSIARQSDVMARTPFTPWVRYVVSRNNTVAVVRHVLSMYNIMSSPTRMRRSKNAAAMAAGVFNRQSPPVYVRTLARKVRHVVLCAVGSMCVVCCHYYCTT